MENSDHDEPYKKKPHLLTSVSSRVSRNSTNDSPNTKNLVDDMALLGIQAGRGKDSLETVDYLDNPRGSLPSCPLDDLLLRRLIQKDSIEGGSNDEITNYVVETLALRRLSTRELLKLIQDTVDDQMERIEDIGQVLHEDLSTEDAIIKMSKIDDMTKKEVDNFREVIDTLHAKH